MGKKRSTKFWLRPSDKQELAEYLPRLERLFQSAKERKVPWASCYAAEITMIRRGLATGRM